MKVAQVNLYLVRTGELHPVLAEMITDSGLRGIGEAGIAYGHGATNGRMPNPVRPKLRIELVTEKLRPLLWAQCG